MASVWVVIAISTAGLVMQLLIGGVYFGEIKQSIKSLDARFDRFETRIQHMDERIVSHGERLARVEAVQCGSNQPTSERHA